MKTILTPAVTFDASERTIDLSAIAGFDIRKLYALIDAKHGALIYAAVGTGLGYTSLSGAVLTLAYDTTSLADDDPIAVFYEAPDGRGHAAAFSVQRPNNTTTYAAGDVVGGPITLSGLAPAAGGEIIINSVLIRIEDSAINSGEVGYHLRLYNAAPPSAYADNAAWDLPSGDRAAYQGKIPLGAPADEGSTLVFDVDNIIKQVTAAGSALYAYLVTDYAFTPGAQRVYAGSVHSSDA